MMYRSKPCLPYFSSVVKNVASPDIEIKKLVYIYLLHYAESEPDLALLSINTIQKSLTDQNPQIRAMALRVMSVQGRHLSASCSWADGRSVPLWDVPRLALNTPKYSVLEVKSQKSENTSQTPPSTT